MNYDSLYCAAVIISVSHSERTHTQSQKYSVMPPGPRERILCVAHAPGVVVGIEKRKSGRAGGL
jgi:hypothetical protein